MPIRRIENRDQDRGAASVDFQFSLRCVSRSSEAALTGTFGHFRRRSLRRDRPPAWRGSWPRVGSKLSPPDPLTFWFHRLGGNPPDPAAIHMLARRGPNTAFRHIKHDPGAKIHKGMSGSESRPLLLLADTNAGETQWGTCETCVNSSVQSPTVPVFSGCPNTWATMDARVRQSSHKVRRLRVLLS
jgi:hypothetical protein